MLKKMYKKAAIEDSGLVDPRTSLPIRVSTTARLKYRQYFDERYTHRDVLYDLNNKELNEIIAQDFAVSANNALHMFLSKSSNIATKKREWMEIRQVTGRRAFNYFFSIIRSDGIDILTTSTKYVRPKKPRLFVPKF